jgi:hypothetical protein
MPKTSKLLNDYPYFQCVHIQSDAHINDLWRLDLRSPLCWTRLCLFSATTSLSAPLIAPPPFSSTGIIPVYNASAAVSEVVLLFICHLLDSTSKFMCVGRNDTLHLRRRNTAPKARSWQWLLRPAERGTVHPRQCAPASPPRDGGIGYANSVVDEQQMGHDFNWKI